jgi:hypothetical protein
VRLTEGVSLRLLGAGQPLMLRLSEPPGPGADRAHTRPGLAALRRSPPSSSVPRTPHRHACPPRPPAQPPHAQWDGSSATNPLAVVPGVALATQDTQAGRLRGRCAAVRAENPMRGCEQQSCGASVCRANPRKGPTSAITLGDHARPPRLPAHDQAVRLAHAPRPKRPAKDTEILVLRMRSPSCAARLPAPGRTGPAAP